MDIAYISTDSDSVASLRNTYLFVSDSHYVSNSVLASRQNHCEMGLLLERHGPILAHPRLLAK
eukprot:scaffold578_cov167-Amphora_coffeaeformis.AAC.49